MLLMKPRVQLFLLIVCSLFLFTFGSLRLPLLGPDEPRYSQIARQMLDSGDYVVPHLGENAWFEKPVLLYWLMVVCYRIFGINELAARFPSVLAALGSVLLTYFIVGRLTDRKRGMISASILATTMFCIGFSHAATFDMLLTFCVAGALFSFLLAESENWSRRFLLVMYTFCGLGVLAKGFVALIIVALAAGSYFLLSRRVARALREMLQLKPALGILIVAGVLGVWFVPVTVFYGWRFWDEFVIQHHFVRYTSSHFHRSQGPFFYLPILLAGAYPWSLVPFFSVEKKHTGIWKFCLCWLASTVLFFSASQSKLPGYILPVAPAFAVLAGLALANFAEGQGKLRRAVFVMVGTQVLILIGLFWGMGKYDAPPAAIYVSALAIGIFLVVSTVLILKRRILSLLIAAGVLILTIMMIFLYLLFPKLAWSDSKELSLRIKSSLTGDNKLVVYNIYDFAPVFYTNGRVELTPEGYLLNITNYQQLYRYVSRVKTAFVLVANEELHWVQTAGYWKVVNIIQGERMSVVELHSKHR